MNTRAFCSISIMLLLCNFCMAQHTLLVRDYLPDTGTKLQKQPVTFSEPGPSGKNRIWSFSEMKPTNKPHQVTYFQIDSLMLGMEEDQTQYSYQMRNDSLFYWGYRNYLSKLEYTQPELKLRFPFNYGDSVSSFFKGTGEYCQKVAFNVSGLSTVKADAWGSIAIGGRKIADRAIRLYTLQQYSRQGVDSISMEVHTYSWYVADKNYPIVETTKVFTTKDCGVASLVHSASYRYINTDDVIPEETCYDDSTTVEEVTETEFLASCKFYPVPVIDRLTIEYEIKKNSQVKFILSDGSGVILHTSPVYNLQEGFYTEEIAMSGLKTGVYVIHIQVGQLIVKINVLKS